LSSPFVSVSSAAKTKVVIDNNIRPNNFLNIKNPFSYFL
jgi:hypothetical protein